MISQLFRILPQALALMAVLSTAWVLPGYSQAQPQNQGPPQVQEPAPEASPYVLPSGDRRETARLNDVCRGLQNSHDCAQAVERLQLPKYPRQVLREKGRLRLTLKGGKTAILKDSPGVSGIAYSFRDYLQDLGYFLVHVQLWEGDGYLMINDRTGARYAIHDLPIVSPDRKRLATLSRDLEAGYNPNALQVWRVTPKSMALEWSLAPQDWGPVGGEWLNNQTLSLVKESPPGAGGAAAPRSPILLKKGASGWQLQEPAP